MGLSFFVNTEIINDNKAERKASSRRDVNKTISGVNRDIVSYSCCILLSEYIFKLFTYSTERSIDSVNNSGAMNLYNTYINSEIKIDAFTPIIKPERKLSLYFMYPPQNLFQ